MTPPIAATSPTSIDRASRTLADLVDEELAHLPADVPAELWERVLLGPARDLLARPGKQLRAALVEAGWALAGGGPEGAPLQLAAAIEILHAGSLVIDDIEDDAEDRRGDAALHRRYGVPVALNTGNWMYFWSFALVDRTALPDAVRVRLGRAMLSAVMACHAGQALDVGTDVTRVSRDRLRSIVARSTALKSGSLVVLAMQLGAIATGTEDVACLARIAEFGAALGLGLQMLDDLGTVTSPARVAKAREDLRHLRLTWAWVWANERADDASWRRLQLAARHVADGAHPDPQALSTLTSHLGELAAHGRDERRSPRFRVAPHPGVPRSRAPPTRGKLWMSTRRARRRSSAAASAASPRRSGSRWRAFAPRSTRRAISPAGARTSIATRGTRSTAARR
ncbi:MAG: polyprenyl synthetase family protein [Proteobacteria bacterium]|nr:polyprenyl synthetase family protein [Pseudomonadota bacterium]